MMDPDQLADVLAGRDAHLELDCPLAVVEAMRAIAIDRDSLRAENDGLRSQLWTAKLALEAAMEHARRQSAADVFAFDGDLDDAGYFCAVGI